MPLPPPPTSEGAVARVRRLQRDDLFGVLGLQRGSGTDEVTGAYRRLVPLVHTDKVAGGDAAARAAATEATQIANDAREVLGDERKRRRYMEAMRAGARAGTWRRYAHSQQLSDEQDAEREARREAKCEARRQSEEWSRQRPPPAEEGRSQQGEEHRHTRQAARAGRKAAKKRQRNERREQARRGAAADDGAGEAAR